MQAAVTGFAEHDLTNRQAWDRFLAEMERLRVAPASRVATPLMAGHEQGFYWAAWEWIAGENLGRRAQAQGLPTQDVALEWISQTTEALEVLHAAGIAHRLISPASIMITDFQQVRLLHPGWGGLLLNLQGGMTNPAFMSVLPFMPPEIAAGNPGDETSDVYQLGANLFYLVSGQPPHWAEDPLSLCDMIQSQRVSMEPARPYATPELIEFLSELLARDPADRPVNLPALRDHLMEFVQQLRMPTMGDESDFTADAAPASSSNVPYGAYGAPPADYPGGAQNPGTGASGLYQQPGGLPAGYPATNAMPSSSSVPAGAYSQPALSYSSSAPAPPGSWNRPSGVAVQKIEVGPPETLTGPTIGQQMKAGVKKPGGGLMPFVILLVVGTLVLLAATIGIGMMLGGGKSDSAPSASATETPARGTGNATTPAAGGTRPAAGGNSAGQYADLVNQLRRVGGWSAQLQNKYGRPPRQIEELAEFGGTTRELTDPWGTRLEIRGEKSEYVLSVGADRAPDTADDIYINIWQLTTEGFLPSINASSDPDGSLARRYEEEILPHHGEGATPWKKTSQ